MLNTLCAGLTLALLSPTRPLDVEQLLPTKDNTLFEPNPDLRSSGAGPQFFAGRVGGFGGGEGVRRGLIAFDVAGSIPAGATINSVTLSVFCSRVPLPDSGRPRVHKLQRALSDWGEGTSDAGINGGQGALPTPGDATWTHTFFPGSSWGAPGGDFTATISSSVAVPVPGPYVFPSTAQLVADVQDMLDSPAGNFGWVVVGVENVDPVARAFDSREAPGYPGYEGTSPVLEIDFTPPEPVPTVARWGVLALALLLIGSGAVLAARRSALA